jgi:hypothetical protein
MPSSVTQIHIASKILRSPHVFDGLCPPDVKGEGENRAGRKTYGASNGGICRDLVLFAAWNNQPVVELKLPDFCRMMGYDSSNLTRRCTDEEVEEIRRANIDEEDVPAFSNPLGLALVRLMHHTLIFPERRANAPKDYASSNIVERITLFEAKTTGTLVTFKLNPELLEQNRKIYQTPLLEEYLSLRTKGKKGQDGQPDHPGHPDDAARRMYLRLTWKRQFWNHLIREQKYEEAKAFMQESSNEYKDLVQVAGLTSRQAYWPPKRVALELRKLLARVGSLPSIQLEADVNMKRGIYEVKWTHRPGLDSTKPVQEKYECSPAPADWGTAPAPRTAPRAAKRTNAHQEKPSAAKSTKSVRPTPSPARVKLRNELDDTVKRLAWLESKDALEAKTYTGQPELLKQHQDAVRLKLRSIQEQLQFA